MLSALARFYDLPFDHPSEVHAASDWITQPTPAASPPAAPSPAAAAAEATPLTNGADPTAMAVAAATAADGRASGDDVIPAAGLDAKAGVALAEVVAPAR